MKITMLPVSIITILLTLTISSCTKVGPLSEKENLLARDREIARMSIEKGAVAAFGELLTEDAIQLPNGADPIFGREAILRDLEEINDDYILSWESIDGGVSKSGDMGWTWGNYILSKKTENGAKVISHGKYMNVWEKDDKGVWKAKIDMGNSNPE